MQEKNKRTLAAMLCLIMTVSSLQAQEAEEAASLQNESLQLPPTAEVQELTEANDLEKEVVDREQDKEKSIVATDGLPGSQSVLSEGPGEKIETEESRSSDKSGIINESLTGSSENATLSMTASPEQAPPQVEQYKTLLQSFYERVESLNNDLDRFLLEENYDEIAWLALQAYSLKMLQATLQSQWLMQELMVSMGLGVAPEESFKIEIATEVAQVLAWSGLTYAGIKGEQNRRKRIIQYHRDQALQRRDAMVQKQNYKKQIRNIQREIQGIDTEHQRMSKIRQQLAGRLEKLDQSLINATEADKIKAASAYGDRAEMLARLETIEADLVRKTQLKSMRSQELVLLEQMLMDRKAVLHSFSPTRLFTARVSDFLTGSLRLGLGAGAGVAGLGLAAIAASDLGSRVIVDVKNEGFPFAVNIDPKRGAQWAPLESLLSQLAEEIAIYEEALAIEVEILEQKKIEESMVY